jgi:alpha-mannosidase
MRMLDSLLVVNGESRRSFRLGVGIDVDDSTGAARQFLLPPISVSDRRGMPTAGTTAWLFHLDSKNVIATHWEAVEIENQVRGFRVRLLETQGRSGQVTLRAFRPITSARQVDFLGGNVTTIAVRNEAIVADYLAFEWMEIEGLW